MMCGGLFLMAVLVTVIALTGKWTLLPLDEAAKGSTRPPQFTLVDFFCLFLLVQAPTGLIHGWFPDYSAIWVLDAFAWGACGMAWWMSVRTLSRAGVRNPWHRGFFLVLAIPIAYFGSITAAVLPVVALVLAVEGHEHGPTIALLVVAEVALCVALYACGWFTRRIVGAAGEPETGSLTDDGDEPARRLRS